MRTKRTAVMGCMALLCCLVATGSSFCASQPLDASRHTTPFDSGLHVFCFPSVFGFGFLCTAPSGSWPLLALRTILFEIFVGLLASQAQCSSDCCIRFLRICWGATAVIGGLCFALVLVGPSGLANHPLRDLRRPPGLPAAAPFG